MRVDREIARARAAEGGRRCAVLQEVPGHPVILAGAGEILDGFAPVAAMELRAAFAGRSREDERESFVERHRHERRLSVSRHAFDADGLRADRAIALEIVERARCAPRPRAKSAPVVRVARLSVVHQTDDAARESGAVVGLDADWIEKRETPAVGDELIGGGRVASWCRRRWRES